MKKQNIETHTLDNNGEKWTVTVRQEPDKIVITITSDPPSAVLDKETHKMFIAPILAPFDRDPRKKFLANPQKGIWRFVGTPGLALGNCEPSPGDN